MTATESYIAVLRGMKSGEIGLLCNHSGQGLDETVQGFDLFAGLWWPLRKRNERAPRREIAWLVAKVYAFCPLEHCRDRTIARQLRRCNPNDHSQSERFAQRFDRMLMLPINSIEVALRWALSVVDSSSRKLKKVEGKLDWVQLTDDLSLWERESTRLKWAQQFLQIEERGEPC